MAAPDPYAAFLRAKAAQLANPVYRQEQASRCLGHVWKRYRYNHLFYRQCIRCEGVQYLKRSEIPAAEMSNVIPLPSHRNPRDHCSWTNCPETKGIELHHTAMVTIFGWEIAEQNPKLAYCKYHHEILTIAVQAYTAQPAGWSRLAVEAGQ
jgi:hypothetical protein